MLEIDGFFSPLTQVNFLGLAGEVQAPRFASAVQRYARCCEASAREQGLRIDNMEDVGVCALLGFTEDRSVIGVQRQDGAWRISPIPVPSALVSRLGVAPLTSDKARPVWARLLPGYLAVFKGGKEVPVWDARGQSFARAATVSRSSNSPVPDI